MPSTLREAVRSALSSLLRERLALHDDIAQDVYRALRDEANLLLERERVCDALDADPFELTRTSSHEGDGSAESDAQKGEDAAPDAEELLEKQKNQEMMARVKDMLSVISCTRTSTPEGYSAIRAVVQLDNDGKMQGVEKHVRLHFTFLREPQHNDASERDGSDADKVFYADADDYFEEEEDCIKKSGKNRSADEEESPAKKRKRTTTDVDKDTAGGEDDTDDETSGEGSGVQNGAADGNFTPKTIVTYQIEYSVDYGERKRLLGVDVYALGEFPSVEEAVPLIDEGEEGEGGSCSSERAQKCDEGGNCCNGDAPTNCDEKAKAIKEEFEEVEMSEDDSSCNKDANPGSNNGDRFGIFIDPDAVVAFLDRVNMNLNEQSVFYFLLTFPFYEHEWDIAGFLLSALCDEDDDEEMGEECGERGDCDRSCEGDLPCCLPCR